MFGFSMKAETEKRAYLTWVIHSRSRSGIDPMKHNSSVTCQLSSVSTCLRVCVLWSGGPESSVVSLISGKCLKKGDSNLLELLAQRPLFSQNKKEQSEKIHVQGIVYFCLMSTTLWQCVPLLKVVTILI